MIHNQGLREHSGRKSPACAKFFEDYAKAKQPLSGQYIANIKDEQKAPNSGGPNSLFVSLFSDYSLLKRTGKHIKTGETKMPDSPFLDGSGKGDFKESLEKSILLKYNYVYDTGIKVVKSDYKDVKIEGYPKELVIQVSDFSPESKFPLNLELDGKYFTEGKKANYECDFFVIYEQSQRQSHYTCARKVGNQWYLIDDRDVHPVNLEDIQPYFDGDKKNDQNKKVYSVFGLNYKFVGNM